MNAKTVVIGVCGGIAAYKSVDVVSRLVRLGADVHVIMTRNACRFVTPLTFQTISRNKVITDIFEEPVSWDVRHVSLASAADVMVVAPATANMIGKVAGGIADDMLSTTIMAFKGHVLFVPAMNTAMYENRVVQDNIQKLRRLGHSVLEPDEGLLACGSSGKGRMPDPARIVEEICKMPAGVTTVAQTGAPIGVPTGIADMENIKVLITAGPTREGLDPVRFISNRSSGKMGYALARAAAERGSSVTLVSGPVALEKPSDPRITTRYVQTAVEMHEAAMACLDASDIVILVAAVSDYRPADISASKLKKQDAEMTLRLVKNPDIAQEIGRSKGDRIVIGACAETEDLIQNAKAKLNKKNFDLIIANDITEEGAGFDKDTNIVTLVWKNGMIKRLPIMAKNDLAHIIIEEALNLYKNRNKGA